MANVVYRDFERALERDKPARQERIKALFAKAESEGRAVTLVEYIKALEMPYLYGDGPNTHPLASKTEAGHNT